MRITGSTVGTARTYASHWKSDVPAIRAAFPGIKIGGPVGSHFDTTGSTYLRDFMTNIMGAGCDPDFISMHVYAEHGEDTSDQAVIDKTHSWGTGIDQMKRGYAVHHGHDLPVGHHRMELGRRAREHRRQSGQQRHFYAQLTLLRCWMSSKLTASG